MNEVREIKMENLPEVLQAHIHELRPVHPCAKMIASFLNRIGYNDDEGMRFCLEDYRQEPDYFDSQYDGKRGCVSAFYGWGEEWNDPRLHGGRGPRVVIPPERKPPRLGF